jgi:polyhydroxyalkanoic acid synthase PhaR subunit
MPQQQNGNSTTDTMDVWRAWLTETERQWNAFFREVLGTEAFARLAGTYMDAYSVVQRALNQGMERYLNTFNLPTHADIVELGERLANIEERLAAIETNINTLAEAVGARTTASVTQLRPARTRKPRTTTTAS